LKTGKIISFIQVKSIDEFYYKKDDYEITTNDIFFSFSENLKGDN
jgi:hypothetical protein